MRGGRSFVTNPLSMKEMKQKCKLTGYESVAAFSQDIELIRFNAYAYNSPDNLGQFGDPVMLPRVETFVKKVNSLLAASAAQLQVSNCIHTTGGRLPGSAVS
jgi:hypothetical protein